MTIRKGEKSFPVFITTFTVVNKETREKIKYDDYRLMSEERRKEYNVYPKLQVYNVFNVAQTNLQEARPELYKKLEAAAGVNRPLNQGDDFSFPAMDKMIKENGWICPIKPVYVEMPTTAFRRMRLSFQRNASSRMDSPSTPISDMRWLTLRGQRTIWAD